MSLATDLTAFLQAATGKTVYWDTTPEGVLLPDDVQVIVCMQVGGRANWTIDRADTGTKHARVNIKVFTKRAMTRDALAALVEDSLRDCAFNVRAVDAPIMGINHDFDLHESTQQFEFWYPS